MNVVVCQISLDLTRLASPVEPGTLCLPCSSSRWYMGVFNWV